MAMAALSQDINISQKQLFFLWIGSSAQLYLVLSKRAKKKLESRAAGEQGPRRALPAEM